MQDIQTAWNVIAAVLAAVVLMGGASAVIVRFYRWATKPSAANADGIANLHERLDTVEERQDNDNRRIKRLEDAIEVQDKENKLLMRGVVQIMSHLIDGNNVVKLRQTMEDIEDYLIEK